MRQEIIEGGFPVWVNTPKSKPLFDEVIDGVHDSFSNRMGQVFSPKKMKFNLRSVVKCPKTERLEKRAQGDKMPLWQKKSDRDEQYSEQFYDDGSGYEEQFYDETPRYEEQPRQKSRGIGPAPRKPGLWRR